MPQVVEFTGPRAVRLASEADQPLEPGTVRVRTWYSGISAGTELTAYRGSNPYLTKTWNPQRRLFMDGPPSFSYPVSGWGYEEVGEIVEVAHDVERFMVGDPVVGIWGHRTEAVISAEALVHRPLPADILPLHGVFARAGAIALNAVIAGDMRLGDQIAVFGQGVIGLLATRMAGLSGARVIAVESLPARLELARQFGAEAVVDAKAPGGAGPAVREAAGGYGVDSAIELAGSYRALHEAIRSVRADGRVVAAGFYQGDGDALRLGEEFHHNRVQVVASQIGGTPLRLGPRWNQGRLIATFLDLMSTKRVNVAPLITHVIDVEDVGTAFTLLDENPHLAMQVVLRFPAASERGLQ